MKPKNLVALVLLSCCLAGQVAAQGGLGQLRSWAGRYPTHKTGRVTRSFFQLPQVRQPLMGLLSRRDFTLLTRTYSVETPIKQIGDYLAVKVCRPHACDTDQGAMAINLRNGLVYVRMKAGTEVRWFGSRGDYTDMPQSVTDYLNDFAAT